MIEYGFIVARFAKGLIRELDTKNIRSNLNSLNTFTKETGSPNVKSILMR
jgi:hypothetical protein